MLERKVSTSLYIYKNPHSPVSYFQCMIQVLNFAVTHEAPEDPSQDWVLSQCSARITSPHSAEGSGIAAGKPWPHSEKGSEQSSDPKPATVLPLYQAEQMLCTVTSALASLLPSLRSLSRLAPHSCSGAAGPGAPGSAPLGAAAPAAGRTPRVSRGGTAGFTLRHLFVWSARSLTYDTW